MRLLRRGVLGLGFVIVGVFGLAEWFLRRHPAPSPPVDTATIERLRTVAVPALSPALARSRLLMGAVGVAVAVWGAHVVFRDVAPASYLGLGVWLIAAVVLHDAVLVPALTGLRLAAHRAGRGTPVAAVRLAEGGFLVAGAVTLLAVPAIYAKHLGPPNPTVLPGSYAEALVWTWIVVAVVTGIAVTAVWLRSRRPSVA